MVIKTAIKPGRPKLPSKRPLGSALDFGRYVAKSMGYYQEYNLQRYDPQVYFDKYAYKPQKRVSGYLGKKIHKSKTTSGNNKFGKARSRFQLRADFNKSYQKCGKSSYCSQ